MYHADHDEIKSGIRSYVDRLDDLESLKKLFIIGLNYDYEPPEISTRGWSEESRKLIEELVSDIKLIAQKVSIDIIYVSINTDDEKEWKKMAHKIFKEYAGYCLIITHKSNDSKWLFTGFTNSNKPSDILLETTDCNAPDYFIDWLVKIKTKDNETPDSLIKKLSIAFDYVKDIRNERALKIQQDKALQKITLFIARYSDYYGEVEIETLQQQFLDKKILLQNLDQLTDLEVIKKTKNKYHISPIGQEIIFSILESSIRNFVNSENNVIKIYNTKPNLPSSFVLQFLKSSQNRLTPHMIKNKKCNLFWGPETAEKDTTNKIFYELSITIFSILMQSYHPLATRKIMEELEKRNHKLGLFCTEKLLSDLNQRGLLIRDGDSWTYSIVNRVLYVMENNSTRFFSLEMIMEKAMIPLAKSKDLEHVLNDLTNKQQIIKISSNMWSYNTGNVDEIIERYFVLKIKSLLHDRKLDVNELIGRLKRISVNPLSKKNQEKHIRTALRDMVNNNSIIMKDGMYMINNHS